MNPSQWVGEVTAVDPITGQLTVTRGVDADGNPGHLAEVPCHFADRVRPGDSVLIADLGGAQAALAHFRNQSSASGDPALRPAGPVTRSAGPPPDGTDWQLVQVTAARQGTAGVQELFVQDAPALRLGYVVEATTDPATGQGWMPATLWVRAGATGFLQVYIKTGAAI